MKGIFNKKYNTVVWDGSNKMMLMNIVGVVGMTVYPFGGKFKYRQLDSEHPTTYVIESRMSKRNYLRMQETLERTFPGACAYNVAV